MSDEQLIIRLQAVRAGLHGRSLYSDEHVVGMAIERILRTAAIEALLAAVECDEAWGGYAQGNEPRKAMERVLRRHGWEPGTITQRQFIDRLRTQALAAARAAAVVTGDAEEATA